MLLFGASHSVESPSKSNGGGATQRAEALAALSSAFNPSSGEKPASSNSGGSSQGGNTQRASALAALSSALNPSSEKKTGSPTAPRPVSTGQGSQRAAALAALSSALTAEKKPQSPDASPARTARSPSPPADDSTPVAKETESPPPPEVTEESQEALETESEPVPPINDEEPVSKDDAEPDDIASGTQTIFSYEQLRSKSENPVTGIDFKRREAYLSEEEFQSIFGTTKEGFYKLPRWKQDLQKKKFDLF